MKKLIESVAKFHHQIGAHVAETPRILETDIENDGETANVLRSALEKISNDTSQPSELRIRLCLALEELCEWVEAHVEGDLVAAADAWGDRCYVLFGDSVSAGLPVEAIFSEVHRSNMTKTEPTGANGKGSKGDAFERTSLEQILNPQVND